MILSITVKSNARHTSIEKLSDGSYRISVNVPRVEGKANEAVVVALAEYFSVPKSKVTLLKGIRGRRKRVEIR